MEKNDYIIDVAADHVYDSQGEKYHKDYTEWRNNPDNRFSYRFIHDSREHIYLSGEGYADKSPLAAEKASLHQCLQFVGGLMIVHLLCQLVLYAVMRTSFEAPYYGWVYYTAQSSINSDISALEAYVYCGMRIFSAIAMLAMCIGILRLPLSVAIPHEPLKPLTVLFGISIMGCFLIISMIFNHIMMRMFSFVHLDVSYYFYLNTGDRAAQVVFYITELAIIPILSEIIFRGYVLQLLRQFGDSFGIFAAALCSACCYHDVTKTLSVFMLSVLLGLITIKNGSLFPGIITKIGFVTGQFLLSRHPFDTANNTIGLAHALFCIMVLIISFLINVSVRKQIHSPFELKPSDTEMSFMTKLRFSLTSNVTVAWLILTLITMILNLRFI